MKTEIKIPRHKNCNKWFRSTLENINSRLDRTKEKCGESKEDLKKSPGCTSQRDKMMNMMEDSCKDVMEKVRSETSVNQSSKCPRSS